MWKFSHLEQCWLRFEEGRGLVARVADGYQLKAAEPYIKAMIQRAEERWEAHCETSLDATSTEAQEGSGE